MKRWLINVETNWCGMDNTYSAYAEFEENLYEIAQQLAYENFESFGGFDLILEELFPEVEDGEYTEEMQEAAGEIEGDYYGYYIQSWDESRPEEEWDWYECVYDGRNIELDDAEELYNELGNISKT